MSKMIQKLGLVFAAVIVMLGTTSYASGTCGVKGCYRSAVYGGSYCSSHICSKKEQMFCQESIAIEQIC